MSHHCFLLHISGMKADINIIFSVPGPLDMSQSGPRGKKINSEQISPLIKSHYLKDVFDRQHYSADSKISSFLTKYNP